MGAMAPMLGGILKSMPEIIDTTSKNRNRRQPLEGKTLRRINSLSAKTGVEIFPRLFLWLSMYQNTYPNPKFRYTGYRSKLIVLNEDSNISLQPHTRLALTTRCLYADHDTPACIPHWKVLRFSPKSYDAREPSSNTYLSPVGWRLRANSRRAQIRRSYC